MNFCQTEVFASGMGGVAIYRIPALLVAPGGTLLAFCEARKEGCADASPTDLVVRRSRDGGQTWASPQVVVRGRAGEAIMNPCPVADGHTVRLFCMNAHAAGHGRHRLLMVTSDDDGTTWSEAVEFSDRIANADDTFVLGPGVSIKTRRGRLVVPGGTKTFEPDRDSDGTGPAHGRLKQATCSARALYSDDGGATWRLGQAVASTTSNESQVVELGDGSLMLNWREQNYHGPSAGCRGMAVSRDGGETWSQPVLVPELPETPCQGSLIRYDVPGEGMGPRRLLFSNPAVSMKGEVHAARTHMTVRLSRDEGRTWPVARLIDASRAAYSCLAALPDGSVGLLYEAGVEHPYERIRYTRFGLDWLEAAGD